MRTLLCAAAILISLAMSCVSVPTPTRAVPAAVSHAAKNVWRILIKVECSHSDGSTHEVEWYGTGFPVQMIDDRIVLMTAKHIIPKKVSKKILSMTAHSGARTLTDGKVLQIHKSKDSALVEFPLGDNEIELHKIDKRAPEFGEIVYVAGYPGGMGRLFLGLGVISDPDINTVAVYPGSSGSPVFDADGDVIAMVNRVGIDTNNGSIISHACYTILMLKL